MAETPSTSAAADGTLGELRELTADLPDDTRIVLYVRKAHDLDHFYGEVSIEGAHVDLTRAPLVPPVVVLTAPEPEDFDG